MTITMAVWQWQSKIVQIRVHNNYGNQQDTKSNPNPNPNPNPVVACPAYLDKFIRDKVVEPFVLLSIVIVTLPIAMHCSYVIFQLYSDREPILVIDYRDAIDDNSVTSSLHLTVGFLFMLSLKLKRGVGVLVLKIVFMHRKY